ncbi:MAG: hypothetical protein IIB94_06420 [Candidatus Marinimicrobia bacterium]|nr:hypothetical protein [Candidatus Neomarinimicrobiota bacterium]
MEGEASETERFKLVVSELRDLRDSELLRVLELIDEIKDRGGIREKERQERHNLSAETKTLDAAGS